MQHMPGNPSSPLSMFLLWGSLFFVCLVGLVCFCFCFLIDWEMQLTLLSPLRIQETKVFSSEQIGLT